VKGTGMAAGLGVTAGVVLLACIVIHFKCHQVCD
jgi:hypothetical protein